MSRELGILVERFSSVLRVYTTSIYTLSFIDAPAVLKRREQGPRQV